MEDQAMTQEYLVSVTTGVTSGAAPIEADPQRDPVLGLAGTALAVCWSQLQTRR